VTSNDVSTRSTADELSSSRPPEAFRPRKRWVLDTTDELSALRVAILAELVAESGNPATVLDDVADNMLLIATELATNAFKYGLPPTEVHLLHTDHVYLLDITDHDADTVPYVAGDRAAGAGGFGLRIAQRLALEVGWYAEDGVKHVWAVLPERAP
jgi:serine/threonine-protein kinase RsbW